MPKAKAGPKGKPNVETYTAQLLLELIEGKPDPQKLRWLEGDVQLDFRWTGSGGSWNHWHIAAACGLWANFAIAPELWKRYLLAQLHEEAPGVEFAMLYYFGGSEQYSNTYEGWRWGCVLAVRLWALRHPQHAASAGLLRLTARYNEVQAALLALGAAPGPTETGLILSRENDGALRQDTVNPHSHRSGRQTWWPGPTLPQSGARSTPGHIGVDDRLPIYCACSFGKLVDADAEKRFGWTASVLRHLQRQERLAHSPANVSLDLLAALLRNVRLLVPHHFLHWRQEGVRLNFMEKLLNGNTTSLLAHVHYDREDRGVYLFPWPGRIRQGLGEAWAGFRATRERLEVFARSRFGEVAHELPPREPDSHVIIGPEGFKRLA